MVTSSPGITRACKRLCGGPMSLLNTGKPLRERLVYLGRVDGRFGWGWGGGHGDWPASSPLVVRASNGLCKASVSLLGTRKWLCKHLLYLWSLDNWISAVLLLSPTTFPRHPRVLTAVSTRLWLKVTVRLGLGLGFKWQRSWKKWLYLLPQLLNQSEATLPEVSLPPQTYWTPSKAPKPLGKRCISYKITCVHQHSAIFSHQ